MAVIGYTIVTRRWIPAECFRSFGSLPELHPEVRDDGTLFVPIDTKEWQVGDALRVVKIFLRHRYDDGTMGTFMEMEDIYCRPGIDHEMNISDPNLIAVACIHKRLTGSKWKCSTQPLILL